MSALAGARAEDYGDDGAPQRAERRAGDASGGAPKRDDRRRAWWWFAAVTGSFVAALAVLVPWDTLLRVWALDVDPSGGLPEAALANIRAYRDIVGPYALLADATPYVVLLVFGLTPLGARLARRLPGRGRLPALHLLLVALGVVGVAWAAGLPFSWALESLRNQARFVDRGWAAWFAGELVGLATLWAAVSVFLLLMTVAARRTRQWWIPVSLSVGLIVLAGSWAAGAKPPGTGSEPLPAGPVRTSALQAADTLGVEVRDIRVVPETPSTSVYNAYVTGLTGAHRVIVYETLLGTSTRGETETVVAHELAHVASSDNERRAVLTGIAAMVIVAAVGVAVTSPRVRRIAGLRVGAGVADPSGAPLLLAWGVLAIALLWPAVMAGSRAIELQADATALRLTGDPASMVSLQAQLITVNLAEPQPAWWSQLFAGHPSPAERVAFARNAAD